MIQHKRPIILFISESVTLAHFARPFELSNTLSENDYDIHFACASLYQKFLHTSKHTLHTINSISSEQFKQALANGQPLYDYATLKSYVEEDLTLIDSIKPDLIAGDFRISLAVSARLAKIPYATISNAYWSPYAPKRYPTPCLTLTRYLGVTAGSFIFKIAAPIAFKAHALSMRRLHSHFGLPTMDLDLRRVYTEADYTLYADIPSLFPLNNPPDNHFFIGPVLWSPPIRKPGWWDNLPTDRPLIYVSMGSSGSHFALQKVLRAFSGEEVTAIASVAGANVSLPQVSNLFTADYLDGNSAAKRADLVICNGGSLTCQQAFAQGKPVLGIAANMDQFLNMGGVSRGNAGLVLRLDNLTETRILSAYRAILTNSVMRRGAENLKKEIEQLSEQNIFVRFISSILI